MKKNLTIILLLISFSSIAQNYTKEVYAYHKITILDRKDNIKSSDDTKGLVLYAKIYADKKEEYIDISVGKKSILSLQIVNKLTDFPDPNIKVEMFQGGQKKGDKYLLANVFFVYLTDKNKNIPEKIRIDIINAQSVIELSGLVKLKI